MNHIIIGCGAAAISAARTFLKESGTDTVVMVSEDTNVISRCMLHRYISGERSVETLNFVNDGLLVNKRLTWVKGKSVTRIDGKAKAVYSGDECIASGDSIIIATGANSVTPPIGILKTAKNAFGLRHLRDAEAIRERAQKAQNILIIGAGLVGLDAASALIEMGKKLTIVEMAPTVLAINMDAHAALAYQRLFEQHGCTFHLGRKVVNTRDDGSNNVTGIELDTGEILPADLVIMAVGVRSACGFVMPPPGSPPGTVDESSGIKVDRSIIVDDYLQTTVPGIYAAGDVTGLSGIWPNAQKQGETAARNILGWKLPYTDRYAMKNTCNFFGLVTLSIGPVKVEEEDRVLIREDSKVYQRLVIREGLAQSVILQGNIANQGFWQHLIKNKIRVDNISDGRGGVKSPWKLSYADFYGMEENGEYKYKIA